MTAREAKKLFTKHIVKLEPFNSEIIVFFTREDFNKAMVWRGHPEVYGGSGLAFHSVLVNEGSKDEDNSLFVGIFTGELNHIVHESVHIALFFCNMIGHEITKYDEILPYLTSYITIEILRLQELNNASTR